MKTHIGLWIDHRKAVIVTTPNGEEQIAVIESHADRHPGRSDGVASHEPHESQRTQADDVTDRKFMQQLHAFYDEVIALVHEAEVLHIFGPGEAKGELAKRLESKKSSQRHVTVETTDKLTHRQIAAHVRESFEIASPVILMG